MDAPLPPEEAGEPVASSPVDLISHAVEFGARGVITAGIGYTVLKTELFGWRYGKFNQLLEGTTSVWRLTAGIAVCAAAGLVGRRTPEIADRIIEDPPDPVGYAIPRILDITRRLFS